MEILDNMETAISEPRDHLSPYAPKYVAFTIPVDRIRDVIGTGGKTINQIIADCDNVTINVDDDGHVAIYHFNQEMLDKAKKIIEDLTRSAAVGEIYDATVSEVRDSFAFVTLFPGTDALLHVSEVSWERVPKISDALHVGDTVKVKVTSIDESGKVKVSAKACQEKPVGYTEPKRRNSSGSRSSSSGREKDTSSEKNVEKRIFRKKEA